MAGSESAPETTLLLDLEAPIARSSPPVQRIWCSLALVAVAAVALGSYGFATFRRKSLTSEAPSDHSVSRRGKPKAWTNTCLEDGETIKAI